MTRITGPDCAVMRKIINAHTHKHHKALRASIRSVERVCPLCRVSSKFFCAKNIIDPLISLGYGDQCE